MSADSFDINLILAFQEGNRAINVEIALAGYKVVATVFTRETFPEQWALLQNSLGGAYRYRILGNRAENWEMAIDCYTVALEIHSLTAFPRDWVRLQVNLGTAFLYLSGYCLPGEKAENLEQAINYYNEALQVHTCKDFPVKWAMTQHDIANIYKDLSSIRGSWTGDSLRASAISCYQQALKIYTHETFPQNYAETKFNLGCVYQEDINQLQLAHDSFAEAIDTVESLRGEIVFGSAREEYKTYDKQKLAEEWNKLYQSMVEVCLYLACSEPRYYGQAIEYVERSKTRNLVELILNRDLKTIFTSEVVTQLEQLRDDIAREQYQLQNATAENPTALAQHLQELRQQRQELQDQYLPVGSGFQFDQFRLTLDNHTAVIEWYITDNKILAFIIKPKSNEGEAITFWQSQPEDVTVLIDWVNEYLHDYDQQKEEWKNQLESRLKKLAQILHIEEIFNQIAKHCDKLILIPHRYLHLFPLHALPIQESYLLELFPNGVSYAPSCQLLQLAQQRQRDNFESVFAIQNPTEDLSFTDLEVNSILPLFSSHQVLSKTQATKTALSQAAPQLQQANYLHFSCHGLFNVNSPLDSCLLLAGSNEREAIDLRKCLTLGNLFDSNFEINQCRLVTLSACETGLIDFKNTSDEYIGLPSGFIYAGAKSVVSSLWAVNDVSTALLMIRFYQNLKASLTISIALQKAQVWLRDSTTEALQEWASQLKLAPEEAKKIEKSLHWFESNEQPFQNPYWWAGFCAVGQ